MRDDADSESDELSDAGPDAVPEPVPHELLTYVEDAIGANLRFVAHYTRTERDFELRPDVETQYSPDELDAIIDDLRLQDIGRVGQEGLYHVGDLYCTMRAFDDALILHFIQGDDRGTVVSVDPTTAPNLTNFISEVLEILHDHSEQTIERAPRWKQQSST